MSTVIQSSFPLLRGKLLTACIVDAGQPANAVATMTHPGLPDGVLLYPIRVITIDDVFLSQAMPRHRQAALEQRLTDYVQAVVTSKSKVTRIDWARGLREALTAEDACTEVYRILQLPTGTWVPWWMLPVPPQDTAQ